MGFPHFHPQKRHPAGMATGYRTKGMRSESMEQATPVAPKADWERAVEDPRSCWCRHLSREHSTPVRDFAGPLQNSLSDNCSTRVAAHCQLRGELADANGLRDRCPLLAGRFLP